MNVAPLSCLGPLLVGNKIHRPTWSASEYVLMFCTCMGHIVLQTAKYLKAVVVQGWHSSHHIHGILLGCCGHFPNTWLQKQACRSFRGHKMTSVLDDLTDSANIFATELKWLVMISHFFYLDQEIIVPWSTTNPFILCVALFLNSLGMGVRIKYLAWTCEIINMAYCEFPSTWFLFILYTICLFTVNGGRDHRA